MSRHFDLSNHNNDDDDYDGDFDPDKFDHTFDESRDMEDSIIAESVGDTFEAELSLALVRVIWDTIWALVKLDKASVSTIVESSIKHANAELKKHLAGTIQADDQQHADKLKGKINEEIEKVSASYREMFTTRIITKEFATAIRDSLRKVIK